MAEQDRVERAAAALRERIPYLCAPSHEYVARVALTAADGPPRPKWPTDETINLWRDVRADAPVEAWIRALTRKAMLSDRIIKEAVKLRDCKGYVVAQVQAVVEAVNKAGL